MQPGFRFGHVKDSYLKEKKLTKLNFRFLETFPNLKQISQESVYNEISLYCKLSQAKDDLPRYYTVVFFSFLDIFYFILLIILSILPYAGETDLILLSGLLRRE